MRRAVILTGACGHLGGTLARLLAKRETPVRALCLPGEPRAPYPGVTYYPGDVRDADSLRPLFRDLEERPDVIHAAGVVDISGALTNRLREVNVGGTRNLLALCREYPIRRFLYVSSVHAIPPDPAGRVLREADSFSPDLVAGGYAKTKAQATQLVLDAAGDGLDAVVVHPSGILGPYDRSNNHLVQMVADYLRGALPACVRGGYDLVDVRDVAQGCLEALERGAPGQCYILSGRYCPVARVLEMVRALRGGRRLPLLPLGLARAALPLMGLIARLRGRRALYTGYSLYALGSPDRFSHEKATRELGYTSRDLRETVRDTVAYLTAGEAADAIF